MKPFNKSTQAEFIINEFLTLKLEDNKTNIYIKNELFIQCKYLLLNLPKDYHSDDINSIDDLKEKLGISSEKESIIVKIKPEMEYWAHCSNLQVWNEYGYNSRLLDKNLAFPLLEKLSKAGDSLAKLALKEEIVERLRNGNEKVTEYLLNEGYDKYLTREDLLLGILDNNELETLKAIENCIGNDFSLVSKLEQFHFENHINNHFLIKNGHINSLDICWSQPQEKDLPNSILQLKDLNVLQVSGEILYEHIQSPWA